MYKVGDKFVVEVGKVLTSERGTRYRIRGFNYVTLDESELDGVERYKPFPRDDLENSRWESYKSGYSDGRIAGYICGYSDRQDEEEKERKRDKVNYPIRYTQKKKVKSDNEILGEYITRECPKIADAITDDLDFHRFLLHEKLRGLGNDILRLFKNPKTLEVLEMLKEKEDKDA